MDIFGSSTKPWTSSDATPEFKFMIPFKNRLIRNFLALKQPLRSRNSASYLTLLCPYNILSNVPFPYFKNSADIIF